MNWYVYIIICSDNSLYTGITTDPERRFIQHSTGSGAKYFRGRKPVRVVYLEGGHSRGSAGSRELLIKQMTHGEKTALVAAAERDQQLLGIFQKLGREVKRHDRVLDRSSGTGSGSAT